jgi:hypothetical protein
MMYKGNDYGGIDAVKLNYSADEVYTNGELEDDYASVQEYLDRNSKKLYYSLTTCAAAIDSGIPQ